MSEFLNVEDCPGTVKHRRVAKYRPDPQNPEETIFAGYENVRATYCWMFSEDGHSLAGRRYINADNSPFGAVDEEGSPVVGYLTKLEPWTGEVKYAEGQSPCQVSQARYEAWDAAGILIDPLAD